MSATEGIISRLSEMDGKQMRTTVRLRAGESGGAVVLRRLNSPLIICDLHDISEMGCRCIARVRISDWSDSEKWRLLLRSGELFEAEITYDPYIPFIRLPVEIRSSIPIPGTGFEIGLAFFDLEPDHRQMLNKAMIAMATEKIKQSRGVLKRDVPIAKPIEEAIPYISPNYPSPSVSIPPPPLMAPEENERAPRSAEPYHVEGSANTAVGIEAEVPLPQPGGSEDVASSDIIKVPTPPPKPRTGPVATSPQGHAPETNARPRMSVFKRPPAPPPPPLETSARELLEHQSEEIEIPLPDSATAYTPTELHQSQPPQPPQRKLGEVLAGAGRLPRPEVHHAISAARHAGQKLGEYLVNEGKLSPLEILQARSAQTGLRWVDLDVNRISSELLELFPFSKMKRWQFIPFEAEDGMVHIAVANPIPANDLAELSRIAGRQIEQVLCHENIPREFLESVARRFERQRRAHPRVKVSLPMSFQCFYPEGTPLSAATFRGRTLDISQGGLQVTGPAILGLEPGNVSPGQLRMMVTVGAVPQDIVGICETRHARLVRGSGGSTSCVYGLKLDQMSPQHRDILNGMIARVSRSQSGFYAAAGSGEHPASYS